ncbi:Nucleoside-diphosphate-sugar epimerase [Malonomonas rubra DSM 5091]|uniref:Nucleoside-diphosphate-sugar epimerase n=1 Tax=Malonomonas rubra DSM 5091 TaxID=1122189 RepID=A0A1M6LI01_MALRU|nr:NAD-dependent epimerase/dehydratase family protein [Malonomonas rubra]SHJ70836.1 Nucleoside-diphosphate-sugar epimerase [Malonomonas rubra DSM 5091]
MRALVTGGGGFLGKAIVKLLLAKSWKVNSFSRSEYPELSLLGVNHFSGALNDYAAVRAAAVDCDIVFHVAAKAGVWGDYEDYYLANVVGTQNVIQACREHGIERLVYTSSPSVVFDGTDMEGVDESIPYPGHFHAYYPQTKAQAEKLVLMANDENLATVALRPHLIWGPEDNHLVPRILERGRKGALLKIGKRDCLVDTIYIDNAAEAHLQAAEKLAIGSEVAGKAYFLSNDEPLPLWDVVNRILAAGNLPPVTRSISPDLAYFAGAVLEKIYSTFKLKGEPRMTRFVARELSTSHWFDLSNAKEDFGYQPKVSIDEGMRRLQDWLAKG